MPAADDSVFIGIDDLPVLPGSFDAAAPADSETSRSESSE
jgi:hypothetical protein